MSTEAEIIAEIKDAGAAVRALKASGGEVTGSAEQVTLKASKAKYEVVTGVPFVGGTVPALNTPRGEASADAAPTNMPPAPPSPAVEAATATAGAPPSSYASRLVATTTKMVGRRQHGTPLFDANRIARYLVTHHTAETPAMQLMLGADPKAQEEVKGWMAFAARVDGEPQDFLAGLGSQLSSVLDAQPFLVTGSASLTLADLAVYLAVLASSEGEEGSLLAEDNVSAPVAVWRDTLKALVDAIAAAPEPPSPKKESPKKKRADMENVIPPASKARPAAKVLEAAVGVPATAAAPLSDSANIPGAVVA